MVPYTYATHRHTLETLGYAVDATSVWVLANLLVDRLDRPFYYEFV